MDSSNLLRTAETPLAPAAEASREFMVRVFGWMAGGLALTAIVSLAVVSTPALVMALVKNPILFYGLLIGELVAVLAFNPIARRASFGVAASVFVAYAVMNGVTFSVLFLAYTASSVAGVFFVTAGTFGAMSLVGATTKRDLTAVGSFAMMGLIGLVIAMVVNLFLHSEMVAWVGSIVGVIVFTCLTAYHTQKLKAIGAGVGDNRKLALSGALTLYLDFVNLFLSLLRLIGRRR